MPQRSHSLAADVSIWKTCLTALKANGADFPYLTTEAAAFEANITGIEKENPIQEKLKAQLAMQTDKVDGIRNANVKLYGTIMRHVRGKYGPNSAKIKEFVPTGEGLAPKPRKKKA